LSSGGHARAAAHTAGQEAARGATRRLFFALWPDDEQRAALADATRKAVRHCGGRPVPAQNLHVTLAFLGSVPQERLTELDRIACQGAAAFAAAAPVLTFDRLAYWARPRLLCALAGELAPAPDTGAAPDHEPAGALQLSAALKQASVAAGFAPDLKPFRAHVTVARKVTHAPATEVLAAVEWCFTAFALVDSRTEPTGPVYSVIDSYSLVNAQKAR
jgi:2'-5' RNA ligase